MTAEASREVVNDLLEEFREITELVNRGATTPVFARLFTRAIFSILDAFAFHLKQTAYVRGTRRGETFSRKDLLRIHEICLATDGTVERPKTIPTGENLLFAIRTYHRVMRGESPPFSGELSADFELARKLRNRITHPKRRADLQVYSEDAAAVAGLFLWFRDITAWESRCEIVYIDALRRESERSHDALREQIERAGSVKPFNGTIEELYTAPKLEPPE
jgi:hypothetical protein